MLLVYHTYHTPYLILPFPPKVFSVAGDLQTAGDGHRQPTPDAGDPPPAPHSPVPGNPSLSSRVGGGGGGGGGGGRWPGREMGEERYNRRERKGEKKSGGSPSGGTPRGVGGVGGGRSREGDLGWGAPGGLRPGCRRGRAWGGYRGSGLGGGGRGGSLASGVGCRHPSPAAGRSSATEKTLGGKDNMR
ncbi:hypothetical protein TIFTF001_011225 [Ficus carica]|uniref:Uncharacterized protein n=1 Tax=Ficus carica TaxID=3494 RepID=A0AA88D0J0_FICCA|nr:hypothetical protein TIFTF001_011225 [Ficus carica]